MSIEPTEAQPLAAAGYTASVTAEGLLLVTPDGPGAGAPVTGSAAAMLVQTDPPVNPRVAVFGAGLIGAYIGGRMAAGGAAVTLIGRAAVLEKLRRHGLRLTDLHGSDDRVAAADLQLAEGPEALADADLILVTVKSLATADAGAAIARHARPGTVVVSFQNGVSNVERLRAAAPAMQIFAGMVPFNVAERAPGHFHQGTGGNIFVEQAAPVLRYLDVLMRARLPIMFSPDMPGVLWGKLIINLNNAVNALSGATLAEQLGQRGYRRVVALSQFEALEMLRRARITPARVHPIATAAFPWVLSLPDWIYRRIAARGGTRIDRHARSSMADDLAQGRRTEVDFLNGEVVALAARLGRRAPVNERIVALVRAAEAGAPPLAAPALRAALSQSSG